jgi:hypothetical protein
MTPPLAVFLDFDSTFFFQILFSTAFIWPALLVIEITLVAQTAGIVLGFPLALGRMSRNPLFKLPVDFYRWSYRSFSSTTAPLSSSTTPRSFIRSREMPSSPARSHLPLMKLPT